MKPHFPNEKFLALEKKKIYYNDAPQLDKIL